MPQNIGTYRFTTTQRKLLESLFLLKDASFRSYGIICFLEFYQLHLSYKIPLSTESAQHGHDIAFLDVN